MADSDRVEIPIQEIKPGASDAHVTFTNGDATNNHYFLNDGQTALIMQSSAGSKTATITGTCPHGRTATITLAPGAGVVGSVGFLKPEIFNQTAAAYLGRVFLNIDNATGVSFAAVRYVKE